MTDPTPSGVVTRYAAQLHAGHTGGHAIDSPLGAWLLVALAAPAAPPGSPAAAELEAALGMPAAEAGALAARLLADPHPAVAVAAAAWTAPEVQTPALRRWAEGLPAGAPHTPVVPTQAQVDAWADEATGGQIPRFPLEVTPATLLLIATALATDVRWREPLRPAPAAELGPDAPLARDRTQVLTAAWDSDHAVVRARRSGVAALVAHPSTTGLLVVSLAAAPDVAPADVLADAHELAVTLARDPDSLDRVDAFELPLADGPVVGVTERVAQLPVPETHAVQHQAFLPAWRAESRHDLLELQWPGVPAAVVALADLLRDQPDPPPLEAEAVQAAVGSFTREGFRAAAITAIGVRAAGMPWHQEGLLREVTLRFGHPHAVVAVAVDETGGPWHGLPVFSAWVARSREVGAD